MKANTGIIKGNLKKLLRALILTGIFTCAGTLIAAAAPKIDETDYEGKGKIEVNFSGKVNYKNVRVCAWDAKGKKIRTTVTDKNPDEIEWTLSKYEMGKTYTFTISGVKAKKEKKYSSVSGKIRIPVNKGKIPVYDIDYDAEDKEADFEFPYPVEWKNVKVKIVAGNKNYVTKICEKGRQKLEVKVRKMKKGKVYRYRISGIRKKGTSSYVTISGSFVA